MHSTACTYLAFCCDARQAYLQDSSCASLILPTDLQKLPRTVCVAVASPAAKQHPVNIIQATPASVKTVVPLSTTRARNHVVG
jgi:hypothetical protein